MKIKTQDLIGPPLDWAVAKCEGRDSRHNYEVSFVDSDGTTGLFWCFADDENHAVEQCADAYPESNSFDATELPEWKPSTDWAHGGPIIQKEKITLDVYLDGGHIRGHEWSAQVWGQGALPIAEEMGETPLVAAMRAFVAAKLGEEVDIPDELLS